MLQIAPSLLSADFSNLTGEIAAVSNGDMLHLDIMDGHFVPNISFGLPIVECVRRMTGLLLDVHLMMANPLKYAEAFAWAGADLICFHLEAQPDPRPVLRAIRACGKMAGMALKPATPVQRLEPYLEELDMVLIMAVEPGFGGQRFQPGALPKIQAVRRMADSRKPDLWIQVDGGIVPETAASCVQAGADVLVAGTYIFRSPSPAQAISQLRLLQPR